MGDLVSICVPCFNADRFVRSAVQSALDQTWPDLEVIVVDDGSSDASAAVLGSIRDPRLTVIRQENKGQCAAANRALRESHGSYIKFFDADDVMSPDHIALQMDRLVGRKDAIALGDWGRFFGDDPTEAVFSPLPHFRDSSPMDWLVSDWADAQPMMQCGLWLIPREVLSRSGPWNECLSLINDFEFFTRVLTHAGYIAYAPGAKLYYRSGVAGSLSGRRSRKAVESAFLSLMLGTQQLLNAENSDRTRRTCANILQDFDYAYFPDHSDLRKKIRTRVGELGGANLKPSGPPGFHRLRPMIGWKGARLAQRAAETMKLNRAARWR